MSKPTSVTVTMAAAAGRAVVTTVGEVVNVEELRACLDSALISGCKHLVGDLRDLRFIDVRGARCFVGVQAG